MKRILYILLILGLNFLNAASLSSTKSVYKIGESVHIKVKDLEYHPKNWIALYPKGKSSAGSNVIRWKWTKEITNGEFTFQTVGNDISKTYLPEGEYEARVMYNNSYIPETVVGFSVKGKVPVNENEEARSIITTRGVFKVGEEIIIKVHNLEYHPKNWIAIYPKGASSAGSNVIRWKWTKETINGEFRFKTVGKVITKSYLPVGEYEARIMYNNSYTPEAVAGFSVKEEVPLRPYEIVSLTSDKAQYFIPEVVKLDLRTTGTLDKRVLKIYRKNENAEWKEVHGSWNEDISQVIKSTIQLESLSAGEYQARVYYASKLLKKIEFNVKNP